MIWWTILTHHKTDAFQCSRTSCRVGVKNLPIRNWCWVQLLLENRHHVLPSRIEPVKIKMILCMYVLLSSLQQPSLISFTIFIKKWKKSIFERRLLIAWAPHFLFQKNSISYKIGAIALCLQIQRSWVRDQGCI